VNAEQASKGTTRKPTWQEFRESRRRWGRAETRAYGVTSDANQRFRRGNGDGMYDLLLARVDDTLSYHLNGKTLCEPGDLYAGYDVGRKRDLSVLIVVERINKGFRWRGAVELREAPFEEQFELLSSVLKVRGLRRLAIDQSGLGMQLAEELVRKHGSRVEPITMTAPVKESLASRILAVFQCGDVSIPDHRPLIDDLHSIQRTVTLSGKVRYAAPREAGSHADRWTALALALHAAGPAPGEPIMISLHEPRLSRCQEWLQYSGSPPFPLMEAG